MDNKKYLLKNSLAYKVFKIIFGLYFVINVLMTSFQMITEYNSAVSDVKKDLLKYQRSYEGALANALYAENDEQVKELGKGIIGLPIIKGIFIYDKNYDNEIRLVMGDVYHEKSKKKESAFKDLARHEFNTFKKDTFNGERFYVGTVLFYYNKFSSSFERVKTGFILLIATALMKTILLFFLFFWAFKKKLITPLNSLANQAKNIKLDDIKEVSLDLKGEENELKVLENSLNFMLLNIKTSQFEIFSSLEKISNLNTKLNQSNLRLEDTVTERTEKLRESLNKTEAMLSNIELAIFTLDSTGKVLVPVSKYSHELFGKNIIGENGLKLLFFHLKDDSLEKKELLLAWKSLFGGENLDFLIHLGNFPKKVIHPDEKKKQGRVLEMHYEPLFNKGGKVDKLMVIVEDVTELDHERRQIRETGQNYNIIMDIMPIEDKESLSKWIAEFIKLGVFTLEKFVASGGEDLSQDQMSEGLNEVFQLTTKGDLQSLNCFKEVISNIKDELKSINRNNKQETYLMSVKTISRIIESLMRHADALNILHKSNLGPKVQYALPENFEISIKEKVLDLERLMVNLLEYVFLVRNVNDLDKDKISNAPKKAMLYAEFDNIINLIMNRSLLISYLFNVVGNSNAYESFNTLSELLKQMPSKNKLTEWALVNHLIEPYKQILEVTKKI